MNHSWNQIVTYHAGGRGLTVGLMPPSIFHRDTFHVLFEADPKAVNEMKKPTESEMSFLGPHDVYSYCLGAEYDRKKLYITANPYASSNFEPNPYMFKFYAPIWLGSDPVDVTYDDMLAITDKLEIDISPLDGLIKEKKFGQTPPPDFFSIDTQGSELAILKGAKNVVASNVLGVLTEFEFIQMYKSQPLFSDILSFLNDQGFFFAGYTSFQEISQYRAPIGVRGKGMPGFGDALFLRKMETLSPMASSENHLFVIVNKLAFMAINYGHIEYALCLLEYASTLSPDNTTLKGLSNTSYFSFLQEFRSAAYDTPQVYPPLFGRQTDQRADLCVQQAHLPPKKSVASISPQNNLKNTKEFSGGDGAPPLWLRDFVLTWLEIPGRVRNLLIKRPDLAFRKLIAYGIIYWIRPTLSPSIVKCRAASGADKKFFPVEIVLEKYGFNTIATLVRQKRTANPTS
jgi:FkbM family methyltransferase